ncbi:MAG: acetolactate synthase small subunit [Pseudomonadota bacterium]
MQKNVPVEMKESIIYPLATVLELSVNNHPGVMSHICGLFARRAYNLEGIVCIPVGSGSTSRMWLRVNEHIKLDQVIKQVKKLPDVLDVVRHDGEHKIFAGLEDFGKL